MQSAHPKIVIVGGGFAGIAVARALHGSAAQTTLIDRNNYHVFQPLLYQVATGSVSAENIATPLRDVLGRGCSAQVLMGDVHSIDVQRRLVHLDSQCLPYDFLVVAAGMATSYFGNAAWEAHAPGLKTLDDALNIRRRVLLALEQAERCSDPELRRSYLTFVVVGGGPTGVEVAGALSNLLNDMTRVRFASIDPASATILLVESSAQVLPSYPQDLAQSAAASLRSLRVQLALRSRVTEVLANGVHISTAGVTQWVSSRTIVWAAGMQASPLGKRLAAETFAQTDRHGRLAVQADMSLASHPEIFVVGDLAQVAGPAGKPLPAVAQAATQAGAYVGKLLRARLRGTPIKPFLYRDLGSMAVIGRGRAVVNSRFFRLTGFVAWLAWLVVHLGALHGWVNKVFVGLQWLLSFVVKRPSARAIMGPLPARGEELQVPLSRPLSAKAAPLVPQRPPAHLH
jgi:NADH dehydrogenase